MGLLHFSTTHKHTVNRLTGLFSIKKMLIYTFQYYLVKYQDL
jgi:hypothetical protein